MQIKNIHSTQGVGLLPPYEYSFCKKKRTADYLCGAFVVMIFSFKY